MKTDKKQLAVLPPLFRGLATEDQALLQQDGVLASYKKGQDLQKEGQIPSRQLLLNTGYATIQIRERVVEIVGPGTIFGSTLCHATPNPCTLRALSAVTAYSFSVKLLTEIWLRNPQSLLSLWDVAMLRVQDYQLFLHHLGTPSLEIRMGVVLWRLGAPQPDGTRVVSKDISQTVLADVLRTTREEISRRKAILLKMGVLLEAHDGYLMSSTAPLILELNEKGP